MIVRDVLVNPLKWFFANKRFDYFNDAPDTINWLRGNSLAGNGSTEQSRALADELEARYKAWQVERLDE